MAIKPIVPGGFGANRCKPRDWFASPFVNLGLVKRTTSSPNTPNAPSNFAVNIGFGKTVLTWEPVLGADTYNVYKGTVSGILSLIDGGLTDPTWEDTGVTSGTEYFYQVTAVNGIGEGAFSTEESVTPQAPEDVTGFDVVGKTRTTIELDWDNVADVSWRVEWQLAEDDWTSLVGYEEPVSSNGYLIQMLDELTNYDIRVQTRNGFGVSGWVSLTEITLQALPEITQVVCVADSNGSLHNKYFLISDALSSVSVTLNGGAKAQEIYVNLPNAADLVTNSNGRFIAIDGGAGLEYYWFNTGTETAPSIAGDVVCYEIVVASTDSANTVMLALLASATTNGLIDSGSSGSSMVVQCPATGPRDVPIPAFPLTTGINIVGRDAAVDPATAGRNISVSSTDNATAEDVAANIAAELAIDGSWIPSVDGDTVRITDAANGVRDDAIDNDTGFSISTFQQGS